MNYNKILSIFIFLLICNCADYQKKINEKKDSRIYYSSSGFALIYDELFYNNKTINKKINNEDIIILHKTLKRNTPVRITNLSNNKYIDSKVFKKANYPKIFNVVISKKIASILELNINNPLVEIIELKKNKTFIAKEGNTFDEEKNVADKAPVDAIEMNTLSDVSADNNKKEFKKERYILVISDFYYENSAIELKKELTKKSKIDNLSIRKISDNKYRLLAGPFKNFNALKRSYISLNNLGLESLYIFNE